jgi:DNA-binding beta-propeller fold protein YncE
VTASLALWTVRGPCEPAPWSVLRKEGSLFFADRGNHQVRVLRPDGTVATVAGTGKAGFADGPAKTAQFNEPIAVAVERTGAIYVADRNNHRIRKISPDGTVITLAGGDSAGFVDGDLKSARFNQPYGVALDAAQTTLYVADYLNHAIRRIDLVLEKVDTLAGNGAPGFADGRRGTARFNQPYNVRVDGLGRIWVPDQLNHAVRRVTPAGEVSTVAGSGKAGYIDGATTAAQFNNPTGIAPLPNGAAVVADRNNNRLRLVTPDGSVTTLAGEWRSRIRRWHGRLMPASTSRWTWSSTTACRACWCPRTRAIACACCPRIPGADDLPHPSN